MSKLIGYTRFGLVFFFMLAALNTVFAGPEERAEDLPRFSKVSQNIFRGGLPSEAGLRKLKRMGVNLILNIEDNRERVENERLVAQRLGFEFKSIPLSWRVSPKDEDINEILEILATQKSGAVYVHCLHGEDRTGLVIGLYRVLIEDWTSKRAYSEMLQNNFHPKFKALDDYFWSRTSSH